MRISDWSSDVCSSDLVEIGKVARRQHPAILQPIQHRGVAALALDRLFKRDAVPLAVADPMLEHEGRRGGVADRPAMRAAVGQAVHRIVGGLQKIGRAHVELQSLMRNSYAVFCLKKKKKRAKRESK